MEAKWQETFTYTCICGGSDFEPFKGEDDGTIHCLECVSYNRGGETQAQKTWDIAFEAGIKQGRQEVVDWIQRNYLIPNPVSKTDIEMWQTQKKKWGLR